MFHYITLYYMTVRKPMLERAMINRRTGYENGQQLHGQPNASVGQSIRWVKLDQPSGRDR